MNFLWCGGRFFSPSLVGVECGVDDWVDDWLYEGKEEETRRVER